MGQKKSYTKNIFLTIALTAFFGKRLFKLLNFNEKLYKDKCKKVDTNAIRYRQVNLIMLFND